MVEFFTRDLFGRQNNTVLTVRLRTEVDDNDATFLSAGVGLHNTGDDAPLKVGVGIKRAGGFGFAEPSNNRISDCMCADTPEVIGCVVEFVDHVAVIVYLGDHDVDGSCLGVDIHASSGCVLDLATVRVVGVEQGFGDGGEKVIDTNPLVCLNRF